MKKSEMKDPKLNNLRKLNLISKKVRKIIDDQGDTSQKGAKEIMVACRLFEPESGFEWYVYGIDSFGSLMIFANLNDVMLAELGTVDLEELKELDPPVYRDKLFDEGNISLKDVMNIVRGK